MSLKTNIMVLLAASLLVKLLVFALSIESSMGIYLPLSEDWKDYLYAYIPTVEAFKSGHLPYADFFYAYPPLFLYALTLFSFLPSSSWAAAFPIVLSDALTVVPVYLISRRLLGERRAFIASFAFALAPINLFYADYLLLNPPLTTFFLAFSLYFLLKGHYDFSAVTLAAAIGFKQTALFALPIVLLFIAKKNSRKTVLRYLLVVAAICFAFSIPYIFVEPRLYLYSVFRVPIGSWPQTPSYFQLAFTNPPAGTGMDTAGLTEEIMSKWTRYIPLTSGASLSLPLFIFLLPELPRDAFSNADLLLEAALLVSYGYLLYRIRRTEHIQDRGLIVYLLYGLLVLFTFDSVYKYYLVGITPFLALLLQKRRDVIAFSAFNFALLLIPRFLTSYLVLLLLLVLLRNDLKLKMKSVLARVIGAGGGI